MNIIPFDYVGTQVRVFEKDGDIWFVGSDVARVLGYTRPNEAISNHCKGTVKQRTLTAGGEQEMLIIPERDVYRLIMRSRLPAAEAFEDWVVGEVLPSIRKTGEYRTNKLVDPTPELMKQFQRQMKAEIGKALYNFSDDLAAFIDKKAEEYVKGIPAIDMKHKYAIKPFLEVKVREEASIRSRFKTVADAVSRHYKTVAGQVYNSVYETLSDSVGRDLKEEASRQGISTIQYIDNRDMLNLAYNILLQEYGVSVKVQEKEKAGFEF